MTFEWNDESIAAAHTELAAMPSWIKDFLRKHDTEYRVKLDRRTGRWWIFKAGEQPGLMDD